MRVRDQKSKSYGRVKIYGVPGRGQSTGGRRPFFENKINGAESFFEKKGAGEEIFSRKEGGRRLLFEKNKG